MRMSMKPPPPILPAWGCTTANANPVATAASMALPPRFMISTPASEAYLLTLTTMALRACTGWAMGWAAAHRADGSAAQSATQSRAAKAFRILRLQAEVMEIAGRGLARQSAP